MKGKGLLGIIASERNNFTWDFIQSLLELKHTTGAAVAYSQIGTQDVARNQILLMALKHDCDWVVMVDSDMTFPKDGVQKLFETMDKMEASIGAGLYFKGSKPHDPVAYDLIDTNYISVKDWSKPREIDACGMGFTVIKKELFGIRFAFETRSGKIYGEDMVFCERAKSYGYKIVLDPSVKCGHLRMIPIDEDFISKHA